MRKSIMNPYSVLGIESTANTDEIKRAYHKAALQHHPDRGGDKTKFQQIQKAYDSLNSKEDETMDMGLGTNFFESLFGGSFGSMSRERTRPKTVGPNKVHDIGVSLVDLYNGKKFKLKLNREILCVDCAGNGGTLQNCNSCGGKGIRHTQQQTPFGFITMMGPCDTCGGKGKHVSVACTVCSGRCLVDSESALDVEITPGMSDGDTIVFSEQCSESPAFDIPGDVVLVIRQLEEPDSNWIRSSKKDLTVEIKLSIAESLLGFERDIVGHPSGEIIRVVWKSGVILDMDVLRVAGKGMNVVGTGDALIVCRIKLDLAPITSDQIQQLKLVWPEWTEPESREGDAIIHCHH